MATKATAPVTETPRPKIFVIQDDSLNPPIVVQAVPDSVDVEVLDLSIVWLWYEEEYEEAKALVPKLEAALAFMPEGDERTEVEQALADLRDEIAAWEDDAAVEELD